MAKQIESLTEKIAYLQKKFIMGLIINNENNKNFLIDSEETEGSISGKSGKLKSR